MADAPRPPAKKNFSMKPALIVGALAVAIVASFSIGAALTNTTTPQAKVPDRPANVPGSSLLAVPAKAGLSVIETGGEPPANVLDAITLPKGAVRGASSNPGAGSSYDRQVSFSVHASQSAVLGFYKAEFKALGWHTVTSGPATRRPGSQVVGQLPGDDGFYWQLGVIVSPSTFSASGTTDITRFTLRILQVQDQL